MAEVDWLLKNATVDAGGRWVDIALDGGKITALDADLPHTARETWDLGGSVVLPGLIDAHVHLDKTYTPAPNRSGTLQEAIAVWKQEKPSLTSESYMERAVRAVRTAVLNGTTAMRTHVDVDAEGDLAALEALFELRDCVEEVIELQIVALGNPGVNKAETAAMRTALELGADLVGGAPALTDDPAGCIDAVFDLAETLGKPIDLHIDETENPEIMTLETLAKQTLLRGFEGRVTAGHCCSLDFASDDHAARVMDKVAEAGLHVVTLPSCNLVLMGRDRHPTPRGVTRVKELLERGVNVAAASDNAHDPFNPLGHYDPLFIANLSAHAAHLTGEAQLETCLKMVTSYAADVLALPNHGLFEGADADLVVLDSSRYTRAVSSLPKRLATFKRGRLVVRQYHQEDWLREV